MAIFEKISKFFSSLTGANKGAFTALPDNYYNKLAEYSSIVDRITGGDYSNVVSKALKDCAPLGSILFSKCAAHINGKIEVINSNSRTEDAILKGPLAGYVNRLIANPNPFQTEKQYNAQIKFCIMAWGYAPELRIPAFGFEGADNIASTWILPPQHIEIKTKNGYFRTLEVFYKTMDMFDAIDKVLFKTESISFEIPKEDLFIYKDSTPLDKDNLLPTSRILHLKDPIQNVVKSFATEGRIISKPLGMFTKKGGLDSPMVSEGDRRNAEKLFNARYGTGRGQADIIFLNTALDWHQLMYPLKDLMIYEGRESNISAICNGIGYPYELYQDRVKTTVGNGKTSDKILYQNYIIPEAEDIYQQRTVSLRGDKLGFTIRACFDHVPALQTDAKEKATVRKLNAEASEIEFYGNVINYEQYVVGSGYPRPHQPFNHMYYWEIKKQYPEFINQQIQRNGNNSNQSGDNSSSNNQGTNN